MSVRPPRAGSPWRLPFSSMLLVGFVLTAPLVSADDPADLVLRDAKIVTMSSGAATAEALAVRGDRLVAVGDNREIDPLIGRGTRVLELGGQLVVPGFIEGHGHFLSLGQSKMELDLRDASSWDDVVDRVASAARETPAGTWIVGGGWHQGKWDNPPRPDVEGYPTHHALSRKTPESPVLLSHGTGHMLFANARAMELAGVDKNTLEVDGGEILRDHHGAPTGVFRENAMELIYDARRRWSRGRSSEQVRQDRMEAFRLATRECLMHGVTSFQDAGASLREVDFFRSLADEGKLDVRLWVMLNESDAVLAGRLADYRMIGIGNHHLTVRAIKRMFDGALGTHGAWLLEPYDDLPRSTGHNTTSLASLRRSGRLARRHGFQLCVHAIGDRANREVLDLFEELAVGRDQRWRIEHAQHLSPRDIPRFGMLGVIASMQGIHCTSDAPFVVTRLGQRRARLGAYAWRALLDSGATVINGSDAPVEKIDPIASFDASVTRKLPNGVAFFPEQRMTREEALRSYTRDAAYAAFEESLKGVLAPGMLADLVVLDRDLLTVPDREIAATRVRHTIIGGEIKYSAK